MVTSNPAPAAVPSEGDVALVLAEARHQMKVAPAEWTAEMAHIRDMEAKHPTYITGFSTGTDALRQARAVLALFAPILAEKEARIRELAMQALADDQQLTASLDRALAAEAALAAVEGKIAKALPDIAPTVEDWLFNGASDQDAAKAIAAAIRAQGG